MLDRPLVTEADLRNRRRSAELLQRLVTVAPAGLPSLTDLAKNSNNNKDLPLDTLFTGFQPLGSGNSAVVRVIPAFARSLPPAFSPTPVSESAAVHATAAPGMPLWPL
ncbi:hypothetical protein EV670_0294 [Rivibacter subsaxonicus]|uniref:Uncharacterized protein n=1 Tax=Rivibacter subsaxonicus TaxID=457575 RepID=A0A4Q7VZH1_9BURK|nr:hypothetical protein EV670_0294 [Rivibacter subsaxonicus]